MQKEILVCYCLLRDRCRIRIYIIAFLCFLSKPFIIISFSSQVALTFRNLAISIAHTILIKANPFALVLARASKSIPYLLHNIIQGTIKWFPLINQLKSISWRLIIYPRAKSLPRASLFLTLLFLICLTSLLRFPSSLSSLVQDKKKCNSLSCDNWSIQ